MPRSRRKQFNAIQAASLARWVVITGFLAILGLIYVYLQVQLYHLGDRKKALEIELKHLRDENADASNQITQLTSRAALQHRLKEGYLRMIPIAEQSIVRLSPAVVTSAEDAVQPVVNQQAGR